MPMLGLNARAGAVVVPLDCLGVVVRGAHGVGYASTTLVPAGGVLQRRARCLLGAKLGDVPNQVEHPDIGSVNFKIDSVGSCCRHYPASQTKITSLKKDKKNSSVSHIICNFFLLLLVQLKFCVVHKLKRNLGLWDF